MGPSSVCLLANFISTELCLIEITRVQVLNISTSATIDIEASRYYVHDQ